MPTGRHAIGTYSLRLVDRSRRDPWVPTKPAREFMIQLWYPAARVTGRLRAPWMTPAAARHFQSAGLLPAGYVTLPDSHAGQDAHAQTAGGRRPVILYSHGHGQHRSSSLSLVEDLASHGYVVVTIDHTYDAGQVEFPGGRVETYGMPELTATLPPAEEAQIIGKAVRVRVDDVRYTLTELNRAVRHGTPGLPVGLRDIMDLSRTAMFGHSLGGATTAEAMRAGLPITAGANLDGSLFGEVVTRGLDRPLLLVGADEPDDTTWLDTWPHLRGWRRFVRLTGSEHFSFTDYEALLPQAAVRLGATPEQLASVIGPLEWSRSLHVQREALAAFFGLHLRGREAPVLDGPTAHYPELVFRKAPDRTR
jgi:dienelactone hydrolase